MVPVQFITHTAPGIDYEASAMLALEGGCQWIQLRMKQAADSEVEPIACREPGATFIIDDRVELAKAIEADGVHLGQHDMPVQEAREFLGHGFIIGGTANTLDDVRRLHRASADYIGAGPFRFTTTKEGLAPILGLEGYAQLVADMEAEHIRLPLCAIGGITLADIPALLATGVKGVAVSGAVLRADNPADMMRRMLAADE